MATSLRKQNVKANNQKEAAMFSLDKSTAGKQLSNRSDEYDVNV